MGITGGILGAFKGSVLIWVSGHLSDTFQTQICAAQFVPDPARLLQLCSVSGAAVIARYSYRTSDEVTGSFTFDAGKTGEVAGNCRGTTQNLFVT